MRKDIEFIAYHKESDELFDVHALTPTAVEKHENGISYIYDRKDVVVMQYTGRNDKNNKKIHEGDLVTITIPADRFKKYENPTTTIITGIVYFYNGSYQINIGESVGFSGDDWIRLTHFDSLSSAEILVVKKAAWLR